MDHSVPQASLMTLLTKLSAFLMLAGNVALFAQSLSLGVKGGVRASDDFQYAATSESRRYVVGPAATVALPLGFAIEFEALYRRQGYSTGNSTGLYISSVREADNIWEFPLLARYRIPLHAIRPFAEAGWAPRITHGSEDVSGCYLSTPIAFTCYSGRRHTDWPTNPWSGGGRRNPIRLGAGAICARSTLHALEPAGYLWRLRGWSWL